MPEKCELSNLQITNTLHSCLVLLSSNVPDIYLRKIRSQRQIQERFVHHIKFLGTIGTKMLACFGKDLGRKLPVEHKSEVE